LLSKTVSDPILQSAIDLGVIQESGLAGESLNHLYGYVGQNPLFWIDPFGLAAPGNHKLDQDQINTIKEKLKDPKLDKKARNELEQKLKRHEKATGERHSRASKDKFLKRCLMIVAPRLIKAFEPSPERACDMHQNQPEFCESI